MQDAVTTVDKRWQEEVPWYRKAVVSKRRKSCGNLIWMEPSWMVSRSEGPMTTWMMKMIGMLFGWFYNLLLFF